jgi:hypothetical protein
MGFRVDNVAVQITINEEFEGGTRVISFSYVPVKQFSFDLDPVVRALLDQNNARLLAAAKAGPQGDLFIG